MTFQPRLWRHYFPFCRSAPTMDVSDARGKVSEIAEARRGLLPAPP